MPEAMLPAVVRVWCPERVRSEEAVRGSQHAAVHDVVAGGVIAQFGVVGPDHRCPAAGPTDSMPRSANSRSPARR